MKRLLVLSPYAVLPAQFGGALRAHNLCLHLSRRYDVRLFAQQVQRADVAPTLAPVVQRVTPAYVAYSSRDPLSVLLYGFTSIALKSQPIWQSAALSARAPAWLRRQIRSADLVMSVQPWQFAWAYRHTQGRIPLVLDAQNVEAALYTAERITAPRPVAQRIARLIEAQERFAVRHAACVFAVSAEDRAALIERYGVAPERCVVAPNGVDCEVFTPATPDERERRKCELGLAGRLVVVFAGSLFHPSVEAARQIIALAEGWPDDSVCFLVVGTVGKAFGHIRHPRIRFTGQVERIEPFLDAADVGINPMRSGSGTNLKQLEYMASGLPTLATPTGARGVPIVDGEHGLVAPLDAFPARLRELLARPDLRARMGASARALAVRQFDWRVIVDTMAPVYERLLLRCRSERYNG